MSRIAALFLIAIFTALPVLPMPGVCHMRHHAMMHPCCAATQTRAPIKAVRIRVQAAPPPAAPHVLRIDSPAETYAIADAAMRGGFWQPLATIQLRI